MAGHGSSSSAAPTVVVPMDVENGDDYSVERDIAFLRVYCAGFLDADVSYDNKQADDIITASQRAQFDKNGARKKRVAAALVRDSSDAAALAKAFPSSDLKLSSISEVVAVSMLERAECLASEFLVVPNAAFACLYMALYSSSVRSETCFEIFDLLETAVTNGLIRETLFASGQIATVTLAMLRAIRDDAGTMNRDGVTLGLRVVNTVLTGDAENKYKFAIELLQSIDRLLQYTDACSAALGEAKSKRVKSSAVMDKRVKSNLVTELGTLAKHLKAIAALHPGGQVLFHPDTARVGRVAVCMALQNGPFEPIRAEDCMTDPRAAERVARMCARDGFAVTLAKGETKSLADVQSLVAQCAADRKRADEAVGTALQAEAEARRQLETERASAAAQLAELRKRLESCELDAKETHTLRARLVDTVSLEATRTLLSERTAAFEAERKRLTDDANAAISKAHADLADARRQSADRESSLASALQSAQTKVLTAQAELAALRDAEAELRRQLSDSAGARAEVAELKRQLTEEQAALLKVRRENAEQREQLTQLTRDNRLLHQDLEIRSRDLKESHAQTDKALLACSEAIKEAERIRNMQQVVLQQLPPPPPPSPPADVVLALEAKVAALETAMSRQRDEYEASLTNMRTELDQARGQKRKRQELENLFAEFGDQEPAAKRPCPAPAAAPAPAPALAPAGVLCLAI